MPRRLAGREILVFFDFIEETICCPLGKIRGAALAQR